MCQQINLLYTCGHRSFLRFDNCAYLGRGCYGAGGKHRDEEVHDLCGACKAKALNPNPPIREDDPYREKGKAVAGR